MPKSDASDYCEVGLGMSLRLEVVVPLSSCKILGLFAGMFDETQDKPDSYKNKYN